MFPRYTPIEIGELPASYVLKMRRYYMETRRQAAPGISDDGLTLVDFDKEVMGPLRKHARN